MDFLTAPDCALIIWITLVLNQLRKDHDLKDLRLWVNAMIPIIVEGVARFVYLFHLPLFWHNLLHILALLGYQIGGMLFLYAASGRMRQQPQYKHYLLLCSVAAAAIHIFYGAGVHQQLVFLICTSTGLLLGLAATFWQRLPRHYYVLQCVGWLPCIIFGGFQLYRYSEYYCLAFTYALVSVVFYITLPKKRLGRPIIYCAFMIWAFCFMSHPWLKDCYPSLVSMVGRIWDLQRFLVALGLLVFSLEEMTLAQKHNALHDQLTGLPNRRLFDLSIEEAIARAQSSGTRFLLLNMDLNHFKTINDTWGHEAGDCLLREVSACLQSLTRETDALCRMSGDEFNLIVQDFGRQIPQSQQTLRERCERMAAQIQERVEGSTFLYAHEHQVVKLQPSICIGYAVFPDDAMDSKNLCRIADNSMYRSKRTTRTK